MYRDWGVWGIIGHNAMCVWGGGGGGRHYTVGNNDMCVQFKGVMGLVTMVLRIFFSKLLHKSLFFIHSPINPAF